MKNFLLLFFLIIAYTCFTQSLVGIVRDNEGNPVINAHISLDTSRVTTTDSDGRFKIDFDYSSNSYLIISHVSFEKTRINLPLATHKLDIVLELKTSVLNPLTIIDKEPSNEIGVYKINPKTIDALTTPFQEFNKILITLPGVVSNNELSSSYSVRGGNFDENLVYVNDIPIYRPFLISNGRQEGLSFINNNLVSSVEFSAGGWQPKYGDKLSSVLNVRYKTPTKFGAILSISLLGGSFHFEDDFLKNRVSYAIGFRHKSSQYLLNTLEVKGQYFPKFSDIQSIVNFKLGPSDQKNKTKFTLLSSYARNRYYVEPASRETEFGNFSQSLRLFVAFEGNESLEFDTYQIGGKLSHRFSNQWKSQLVSSFVNMQEREYTELESGYRLCDLDKNIDSDSFNECVFVRGIGKNYDFGRNNLAANIITLENRHSIFIDKTVLEFGIGYTNQNINDYLHEYSFADSSDYVSQIESIRKTTNLSRKQGFGFIQASMSMLENLTTTFGIRTNYSDLNKQWLFSPRFQIEYQPISLKQITLKAAIGLYQQPPFFRELRGYNGFVNTSLKAQSSTHFIVGMNYKFLWWRRPFIFNSELYYKKINNVIPYEVDNVKIRYYPTNNGKAFATGIDFRLSGEFIDGIESWFSLGIQNVREDVFDDSNSYIRRPTDQRLNLAIFFQDHIPNHPDVRVNLNLLFGSGLPFGPPKDYENRNSLNGDRYTRVDVGFSKVFLLNRKFFKIENILLQAEILNLLGNSNPISYTWVNDLYNNQYAIPNSLSARFFNIRATIKI